MAEWKTVLGEQEVRSLVDVGCGPGLFVRTANDHDWQAEGCDIDGALVSLGNRNFGLQLKHADLPASHYSSESYEVVRLKFVLEHLPNPLEVLVEAKRILKPGGITLIIVPNEAGLVNKVRLALGGKSGNRWGTLTPPHHLHAFTPTTLHKLLKRAGFDVPIVKTVSPLHRAYAPNQGIRGIKYWLSAPCWQITRLLGQGSVLVAYGRKPAAVGLRRVA